MFLLDPRWWIHSRLAPYVGVFVWGAWLCYRHRDRRPHEAKWVVAAIVLLIVGMMGSHYEDSILSSAWGQSLINRSPVRQGTLMGLFRLPFACALGCLCWAIFGNVRRAEESDDVPPVFRKEGEAG